MTGSLAVVYQLWNNLIMSKKQTNPDVSRREALRKIGQCAEYTGAVVAFLSVSSPSWASVGTGTKPGCGGVGLSVSSPKAVANGCVEIEFDNRGATVSSNASGKINGLGQINSSSAVSNQATGGINNSVSLKVDNSVESQPVFGPNYQ